jgi:hypothetical protein
MIQLQNVPSLFVWNTDETRIGISKKDIAPDVIVAKQTPRGTVTIAEENDESQMRFLTGISAYGGSIPPLFIIKSKSFEAEKLTEQQLFHSHGYVTKSAEKTSITEVLFIDGLQT